MLDITTLAAWGEFIGGIAVVASLIYLASQIRQNSRLLRASTTASSNQVMATMTAMLAQDPEVARIYAEGTTNRDSLSEADRARFNAVITLWLQAPYQHFQFERDGISSPAQWVFHAQGLAYLFQSPGAQQWWHEFGGLYGQEFRDYVDNLIREGEAAG